MLDLQSHPDGTILPVRAQPGARRNEVRGLQDGCSKVCVTQAPEKGKANKAIVEVLAKWLGVRKSQIELISGETASRPTPSRFPCAHCKSYRTGPSCRPPYDRRVFRPQYDRWHGWPE